MSEFLEPPFPEDEEENRKLLNANLREATIERGREAIRSYNSYIQGEYAEECVEQGFLEPFDAAQNGTNFIPAEQKNVIKEWAVQKGFQADEKQDFWMYEKYDEEGSEFLGMEVYAVTEKMREQPKEAAKLAERLHERLGLKDAVSGMAKEEMLDTLMAEEGGEHITHPGEMSIEDRDAWLDEHPDVYAIDVGAFDENGKRKSGMCDFYAVFEP